MSRPPAVPQRTARSLDSRQRRSLLARASLGTAAGTVLSRVTGLIRLIMIASVLSQGHLSDAFNLANNTPNIVHDLVLGGILAATFVPVFVDRLATRSTSEAVDSISAVITLSAVVLIGATILFVFAAPAIIDMYTFGAVPPSERSVAVELLRFFAPQLLFYGAISLMSAVLATRDRFASVSWVSSLNNVIGIIVLGIFAARFHPRANTPWPVALMHDQSLLVFLGVGTSLGVGIQALALVPSMRRAGIRLRVVWRPRDPAVRLIASLSSWTFGFVVANQLAVFIVLILATHIGPGEVSAYTYAFTFFQFPFAVVATSIVNVASPDLARAYGLGDLATVGKLFGRATNKVLALILPATVGYLVLAHPAMELFLHHGAETLGDSHLTAEILALFSLGLPGYCVFFLSTRTFQAMQDTRTAFVLYALENGTNILLAIVLYRPLGVQGLALSYSIAYTVAAIAALFVLRERLGTIGGRSLTTMTVRSGTLSLTMALVVAFVSAVLGDGLGVAGWIKLLVTVLAGLGTYLCSAGVASLLSAWQNSRRTQRITNRRGIHGRHLHRDR